MRRAIARMLRAWNSGREDSPATAGHPLRGGAPWLHVLQCDSRPFAIHGRTRDLSYDPHDDSEAGMRALNEGSLVRPWDYWSLSVVVNRLKCAIVGCPHAVVAIRPEHQADRHVTWGKIRVLLDYMLAHPETEIVALIDSDAFIRDEAAFLSLAEALRTAPGRHGAMSRDPLMPKNTFINTGCLILKNTPDGRGFLETVWQDVAARPRYRYEWPHEQWAASEFVRAHREAFYVCRTAVLNTPCGEIVRHTWWKHQFAELAEDEIRSTIARLHCGDLLATEPAAEFDLESLLDRS